MSTMTADMAAASITAHGSAHRRQTFGYFAAFVALGLTIGSFGPTLPGLATQTHARLSAISFLFMARSCGYLLGSLRGGPLYDRVAGQPLMAGVLLSMAALMALVPLVPSVWLLLLVLLVLGAAEGALDVGGNVMLVRVHHERVAPYMNGLHFCFGVGAFVAPLVVAQALSFNYGIQLSYWTLALFLLPVAGWLLRLPGPARAAEQHTETAAQIDNRLLLLIALFFFLYVGAEVSFGGWVYTYTVALNLSSAKRAAYLTSAFWGALTFGRLLAVPLAARFRPRTILSVDLCGCLLSVGLIMLRSDSFRFALVGTLGLGLAMASIFPTMLTFAGQHMTINGRVTRWFIVGASAGSMCLPWLIGQFFERTGARIMSYVIMSALLLAGGVLASLIRFSARPEPEELAAYDASHNA